jgi:hypothetical protein
LLAFYNRGHPVEEDTYWPGHPGDFMHRDIVWLVGGSERGGRIEWGPPEVALYAADDAVRIGYVGMHESQGHVYLALTDKKQPTLHRLSKQLHNQLIGDACVKMSVREDLRVQTWPGNTQLRLPDVPENGVAKFTLEVWVATSPHQATNASLPANVTVLDASSLEGSCQDPSASSRSSGFELVVSSPDLRVRFAVYISGQIVGNYAADKECSAKLGDAKLRRHHVALVFDGDARIMRFVIAGEQCDGGADASFGFYPFRSAPYGVGRAVEVGKHAATIRRSKKGAVLVRYDGWSSRWDEWVGVDKVHQKGPHLLQTEKYIFAQPVQVCTQNRFNRFKPKMAKLHRRALTASELLCNFREQHF